MNPSTGHVYVALSSTKSVALLNALTGAILSMVPVGSTPIGVATNTNTGDTYVTNAADGTLSVLSDPPPPPPNDFSISASPTSVTVVQGASGSSTISTATISGSAETVTLSVSGAPSGVTATFSPTSVTSGGGATL